jgi:hypothetical protein
MRWVNPESTDRVRSSQVFQDVVTDEGNDASFEFARRDVLDELFLSAPCVQDDVVLVGLVDRRCRDPLRDQEVFALSVRQTGRAGS